MASLIAIGYLGPKGGLNVLHACGGYCFSHFNSYKSQIIRAMENLPKDAKELYIKFSSPCHLKEPCPILSKLFSHRFLPKNREVYHRIAFPVDTPMDYVMFAVRMYTFSPNVQDYLTSHSGDTYSSDSAPQFTALSLSDWEHLLREPTKGLDLTYFIRDFKSYGYHPTVYNLMGGAEFVGKIAKCNIAFFLNGITNAPKFAPMKEFSKEGYLKDNALLSYLLASGYARWFLDMAYKGAPEGTPRRSFVTPLTDHPESLKSQPYWVKQHGLNPELKLSINHFACASPRECWDDKEFVSWADAMIKNFKKTGEIEQFPEKFQKYLPASYPIGVPDAPEVAMPSLLEEDDCDGF